MTAAQAVREREPLTVLVVEDEAMLRQIVAATLRLEGFDVIEAADGAEGLEILQSGQAIDAMLTDVRMPRMNGYELAEASLSLRHSLPVIFMTGFAEEEMPEAIRKASIPIIRKPFNFANLGNSIRDVIAAQ